MFELSYNDPVIAREAIDRAIQKLPIKCRFVAREEGF
jgi:large subunit ribosomal protein L16